MHQKGFATAATSSLVAVLVGLVPFAAIFGPGEGDDWSSGLVRGTLLAQPLLVGVAATLVVAAFRPIRWLRLLPLAILVLAFGHFSLLAAGAFGAGVDGTDPGPLSWMDLQALALGCSLLAGLSAAVALRPEGRTRLGAADIGPLAAGLGSGLLVWCLDLVSGSGLLVVSVAAAIATFARRDEVGASERMSPPR